MNVLKNFGYKTLKLLPAAALLVAFTARAPLSAEVETPESQESIESLESLVEEALRYNPEIKAERARWEASTKRPSQEGALPNPTIGVRFKNVGLTDITQGEDPRTDIQAFMSQEIPFPGKLSLKAEVAWEQSEAQRWVYDAVARRVKADLKVAYHDWFLASKSIEITLKNKDLLGKFLKIAEAKYSVGEGIQQDVLKAQVELSRFIEQLELLGEKKGIEEAKLRSILNRPPDSPLGEPEEVEKSPFILTEDEIYTLTQEKAPLLKSKERLIESEKRGLDLAKKQYFPDFIVQATYFNRDGGDGNLSDLWQVGLGMKVPLYFWRKEKFGVDEAVSRLQAAREDYSSANQSLFFIVKDHFLVLKTSENLLELFEQGLIPQSSLSLESAIAGYRVGNIDFLTLLDNLITLFNFELTYYTYLTNYQNALARIEEVIGIDITGDK